jgi:hypothetical protein
LLNSSTFTGFILAMCFFGLGYGSLIPAYESLISKVVPEEKRGLAFGFFGTSLGSALPAHAMDRRATLGTRLAPNSILDRARRKHHFDLCRVDEIQTSKSGFKPRASTLNLTFDSVFSN